MMARDVPGLPHHVRDVLVPCSMLRDPARFGGTTDGDCTRGDLVIRDRHAVGLRQGPPTARPRMILPALTEAHCHLDKCHTIHRLGAVGGDLDAALTAQRQDKVNWTEEDLKTRARHGMMEAARAGCSAMRTHVDWGETPAPPLAWHVMTDLARGAPLTLQCAALTGIDQMADSDFAAAVADQVAQDNGVLGAFVRGHEHMGQGINQCFEHAKRLGIPLDFHVDEGLAPLNGLEVIADAALAHDFKHRVLCGHAVSLMDKSPDTVARIGDKLARAGIAVCALPTTNLYLQGRENGTPERRGITRLRELRACGVKVLVGSDNVGDAFCPVGHHDPMAALHLAVLGAHLDPPLGQWLPAITTDARAALGFDPIHVDGAAMTDLRIADARTTADLVAGRSPLRPALEA